MSISYGFYNSVNHDRVYDALDMSKIFDGIINDGVFQSVGTALQVTADTGLTVQVGIGRAWFDHTWTYNDAILPLELGDAEVSLTRIDAVVLEVDSSDAVRANTIKIVPGPVGASPSKPAMTNTATVHQHALAYITIGPGATTITQANIENAIGTSETPYVTGILETLDADALLAQWQTQYEELMDGNDEAFHAWFEHLQDELDENQAANLQNQIDAIAGSVDAFEITVPYNAWVPNTGSTEYTLKATVNNSNFDADFIPQYIDLIPADGSAFFSEEENKARGLLNPNVEIGDGTITFYMKQESPLIILAIPLKFRIGGHS